MPPPDHNMTSKHPATNRLLNAGLFDRMYSFDTLEARISALPGNKGADDLVVHQADLPL